MAEDGLSDGKLIEPKDPEIQALVHLLVHGKLYAINHESHSKNDRARYNSTIPTKMRKHCRNHRTWTARTNKICATNHQETLMGQKVGQSTKLDARKNNTLTRWPPRCENHRSRPVRKKAIDVKYNIHNPQNQNIGAPHMKNNTGTTVLGDKRPPNQGMGK